MESGEVSIHLVKVVQFVASTVQWVTAAEVSEKAGVAGRTARHHLARLVDLGILDQAEVFPGHRYKLSEKAEKRNKAFLTRLRAAFGVFGLEVPPALS